MLGHSAIGHRLAQLAAVVAVGVWLVSLARLGGVEWRDRYLLALGLLLAVALLTVAGTARPSSWRRPVLASIGIALGAAALVLPRYRADGFVLPLALWAGLWIATSLVDRSERWARVTLAMAVVAGALEALYGWSQFLGLLATPSSHVRVATGTFFNRNHFAGLVAPLVPLALAFAVEPGSRWSNKVRRVAAAIGASGMAAAVILSRSRGGAVALGFAILVLAVLLHGGASGSRERRRWIATIGCAIVTALALGLFLARSGVASRFEESLADDGRSVVWSDTLRLIGDHPLVGVGPGGYGERVRRYQSLPAGVEYVHAHNAYLETAANWGIPLALVIWISIGRIGWRPVALARKNESVLAAGCAAALGAFLVHALVDFNLRMPATGVLFFVVLGVGWTAFGDRSEDSPESLQAMNRWMAPASVLLIVVSLAVAAALLPRWRAAELLHDEAELGELRRAVDLDPNSAEARSRLGKKLLGSLEADDREEAARELQLGLDLAPTHWGYYLEAARAHEIVGDLTAAERTYLAALEINPRSGGYHWQWTNFLVRQGRVSEAVVAAVPAVGFDHRVAADAFTLLVRSGVAPFSLRELWLERPVVARAIAARLVESETLASSVDDKEALLSIGLTAFVPASIEPSREAQDLVSLLLTQDDPAGARELWSAMLGADGWSGADSMTWNGEFTRPLTGGGLGWSVPRELVPAVQAVTSEGIVRLRPVLLRDRAVWMRQRVAVVHPGTARLEVSIAESRLFEGTTIEIDLVDTSRRTKIGGLSIRGGEIGRYEALLEIPPGTAAATLRLSRVGESSADPSSVFALDSLALRALEPSE